MMEKLPFEHKDINELIKVKIIELKQLIETYNYEK